MSVVKALVMRSGLWRRESERKDQNESDIMQHWRMGLGPLGNSLVADLAHLHEHIVEPPCRDPARPLLGGQLEHALPQVSLQELFV